MPSAAEKFASNINLGVLGKATELKKRLWFTLLALIVYRIGTYIPLPGIDPHALHAVVAKTSAEFSACSICSPAAPSDG